ncbi:MAG: universal stress protein [Proteobacteria bacterium]|nr:universal stress protein [Pseudomonadota bacterium]
MLQNYRNILVATDLTPTSVFAFQHAVMMARLSNAQLQLLHVVPEVDASIRGYVSTIMGAGSLDRFEQQHEEKARSLIKIRLEKFAREE